MGLLYSAQGTSFELCAPQRAWCRVGLGDEPWSTATAPAHSLGGLADEGSGRGTLHGYHPQLGESVQERFKGLRKRRDHRRVVFGPNMKSTSPELADRSTRVHGWGVCLTF